MPKSRKNPVKKIKNRTCWKMTSVEKEIVLKRIRRENKAEWDNIWDKMEKSVKSKIRNYENDQPLFRL